MLYRENQNSYQFIDHNRQIIDFPGSHNISFVKNICVADEILFKTPQMNEDNVPPADTDYFSQMKAYASGVTELTNNIFYSKKTPTLFHQLDKHYNIIQTAILEKAGNVIGDPQFQSLDDLNFTITPKSPAMKMGIEHIDFSTVGRQEVNRQ